MTRRKWLTAEEERAWRAYRRMRALLDLQITRDLSRAGLSDADYDVLSNLSESPGRQMRLKDLADHMLWSQSRLSHQLTRMQRRGLVSRAAEPTDGRAAVVGLSPGGWELIRAVAPRHVRSVRDSFLDVLSPAQVDALGEIAQTVVDHLSPAPRAHQ